MRVGNIVGGDHDHPPGAPVADPVFGQPNGLRGARAGGVDLGIGSSRANVLGELRVTHSEHAEEKTPVKLVRLALDLRLHRGQPALDLGAAVRVARAAAQLFQ